VDEKLQRRVQRYGWDRAADYYEGYWAKQLEPAQQCMLEMAALQTGEQVLDVACGTGLVTFPAAESVGDGGSVVATDISDAMVDTLRSAAQERGLKHVTSQQMGAEDLSLEEGTFDAALCGLGLMYFPDPIESLRQMRRVLKPRGRAVAAVWGHRDRCGWAEIFPIVDSRVSTEVCPLFFQLGTGDAMKYAFEAAGFAKIEVARISTVLHYDTADDALGAAFVGGPVALAYSRFDDATRDEAHTEYLASIESYRNDKRYAIPGEFVIGRGEKLG
jgi:ubiquinone/menaquinone biosynthesis C-methylase UbiE